MINNLNMIIDADMSFNTNQGISSGINYTSCKEERYVS